MFKYDIANQNGIDLGKCLIYQKLRYYSKDELCFDRKMKIIGDCGFAIIAGFMSVLPFIRILFFAFVHFLLLHVVLIVIDGTF